MKIYQFALVNSETGECLGLITEQKPLQHRNKLSVRQFNRITGESTMLTCHMSQAKGDLDQVEHLLYETGLYKSPVLYSLVKKGNMLTGLFSSDKEVVLKVRDKNLALDRLSHFIEQLKKSANYHNNAIGEALDCFHFIDGFIPTFDQSIEKTELLELPQNAVIFSNKVGVFNITKIKSIRDNMAIVDGINYCFENDEFKEKECELELELKPYTVYGYLAHEDDYHKE